MILNDVIDDEHKIENSNEERYLGDMITTDGKNFKNVSARKGKGFGIVDKILSILNDVYFGPYYFQAALMLRNSLLLSSILLNSECWYHLTNTDIQSLETVDNTLHRRILESAVSTPISILHLELGTIPIRYLIKCRRLIYLQYILKQDKNTLLYKFFQAQVTDPKKGDWVPSVIQDIKDVNLNMDFDEISLMSENSYTHKVKVAIRKAAFNWLISEKNKPRPSNSPKGINLNYTQLKLQDYFLPNAMSIKQCNLLFSLRADMVNVRRNFKHSFTDMICPICHDSTQLDTQPHILQCVKLLENENLMMKNTISYSDIFSQEVHKQVKVTKLFDYFLQKRRKIEKATSVTQVTQVIRTV